MGEHGLRRDRIAEIHFYEWRMGTWMASETRDRLDATGRGIYRELLDSCYAQGDFPDEPEWICRRCACNPEQYERCWKIISRHFPKSGRDGYRHNILANIFRKEYFEYVGKQQYSRKCRTDKANREKELRYGGNALEERAYNDGTTNGNGNGNGNVTTTEEEKPFCLIPTTPELNGNGNGKRPKKVWYDDHHEIWYKAYWCRQGKPNSRKQYEKAINRLVDKSHMGYNQARVFLAAKATENRALFESTDAWEWRGNMHPGTWLNGEAWNDEPTQAAKSRGCVVGADPTKLDGYKELK